jgi:alpha-acetolactate decarboxylase
MQYIFRNTLRSLPILAFAAFLAGCVSTTPYDQLTVFGAGDARAKGTVPAYRLRSAGTWGAGRLASGKADMVFDGLYYYRLAAGRASSLTASESLSEGWGVRFRPDLVVALPANFNKDVLLDRVNRAVPDDSMSCAFRVTGQFTDVAIASPAGNASILNPFGNLYGIRTPGLNGKTRSELWFLSSDYSAGGRVTDFNLADGSLAIDLCPSCLFINTAISQAEKNLK